KLRPVISADKVLYWRESQRTKLSFGEEPAEQEKRAGLPDSIKGQDYSLQGDVTPGAQPLNVDKAFLKVFGLRGDLPRDHQLPNRFIEQKRCLTCCPPSLTVRQRTQCHIVPVLLRA